MAVFRKQKQGIPVASQGAKTSQRTSSEFRWAMKDGGKHLMSACSLYMHAYTHEHMHANMDIDMQTRRMHIYQNKRVKPTSPQKHPPYRNI